jgi:hypothetical protein
LFLIGRNQTVSSTFKHSFIGGAIVALVLGLWLAQLWSAENQVRLHSEHFLRQIEKRKAAGAGAFLAPDYHDDWGHDRALVLDRLRLVLPMFASLTLTVDVPQVTLDRSTATWSASIHLEGTGGEFAPGIIGRVNSLTTPFELHWRRESWRPWDWNLVQVSNPALDLRGGME